jgi:gamma-glutamyltranspeptidase/glutathione hydrolase
VLLLLLQTTFPTPISTNYRGVEVWEIPPNGQGLAGLIALNILEGYDVRAMGHNSPQLLHTMIEAMRLSFADAQKYIADSDWEREQALPTEALLSKDYAAERRALIDPQFAFDDVTFGTPANSSGTIYFCVADPYGNACSFINSNFAGVGTGIVPEGCGFTLQNRGGNFVLDPTHPNALEGGKRPYHTIIPGMATTPKHQGGGKEQPQDFYAAFGVMGGFMQPQGHMQVISNMVDFGMDPQAALDADRFQVAAGNQSDLSKGVLVTVEEGISESTVQDLIKRGYAYSIANAPLMCCSCS